VDELQLLCWAGRGLAREHVRPGDRLVWVPVVCQNPADIMPPADGSTGAYRPAAPGMPRGHGQPPPLTRPVRSRDPGDSSPGDRAPRVPRLPPAAASSPSRRPSGSETEEGAYPCTGYYLRCVPTAAGPRGVIALEPVAATRVPFGWLVAHYGVVVLKGQAPGNLRWRLGRQQPEIRFHGDRRIPRGARESRRMWGTGTFNSESG
jgi:hypothetical protein